jgi:hypothetical protein
MITVVSPWYLNTSIASCQLNVWNALPGVLKDKTKFILVDDGSPQSLPTPNVDLNLIMARIKKDIPWNQPGARNLGAHLADTQFLFFTDIDHEITVDVLKKAHEKIKDPFTVYRFKRIFNGQPHYPHPCSFVISKKAFDKIGGFDEDFSGHRGQDDTMFRLVAQKYLKHDMIDGALILHEFWLTRTLDRDNHRNTQLLENKKKHLMNGTYKAGSRLRFDWEIVYQTRRKTGLWSV